MASHSSLMCLHPANLYQQASNKLPPHSVAFQQKRTARWLKRGEWEPQTSQRIMKKSLLTPEFLLQALSLSDQVLDGNLVHQRCRIGLWLPLHQRLRGKKGQRDYTEIHIWNIYISDHIAEFHLNSTGAPKLHLETQRVLDFLYWREKVGLREVKWTSSTATETRGTHPANVPSCLVLASRLSS